MKHRFVLGFIICLFASLAVKAQYFNHLDIGLNAGVTGIGLDVAMPVGDYVRLRTGFTYMPQFKFNSSFGVETEDGMPVNTQKAADLLGKLVNMKVDDKVSMEMTPTFCQYKLLVDIMPFKNNKHWNFTFGFYVGPSRIGKAYNVTEDAPTLLGVTMYNYFYINSCRQESMFGDITIGSTKIPDVELSQEYLKKGMMGMPLGTFKDGDKAMLVPDANGMVKAEMKVNSFRPYIGAGYTTSLSKDHRWNLAVDAGVLFWGGSPKVYVDNVYKIDTDNIDPANWKYDIVRPNEDMSDFVVDEPLQHVDMMNDLKNIDGKVGKMVDNFRKLKVLPNLNFTLSYRIF